MRSYINVLFDYKKVPFEKEVTIQCPTEHIESQMKHLTRSGKKTLPADVLQKGDVAVLSLESILEKFNKPAVFVTIGGGLFDEEFEDMLIGHRCGEAFELNIQNNIVKVNVKQATRTVFPAPTDEMAENYCKEHGGFEGIKTVEEYKNRIVEQYITEHKNNVIYDTMSEIIDYVLTHSDWEFDDDEIAEVVAEEKGFIEEELKADDPDKTISDLTQEELQNYFGASDFDELDQIINAAAEQMIAGALWCADVYGIDVKTVSLDDMQEKQTWNFLEDYVRNTIKITEVI